MPFALIGATGDRENESTLNCVLNEAGTRLGQVDRRLRVLRTRGGLTDPWRREAGTALILAGGTLASAGSWCRVFPDNRSFHMREKRRMAAPASARSTKASTEPMTSGFALMVDGHIKASFESGRELKARFPHLQVKIFDAETKRSEAVAGA
jgi:hypothetical protein